MVFQNEDVKHPNQHSSYLADIPNKFFKAPYLSDECSFCKTRMIHPALGLYICPNEKCQYSFKFHPEKVGNSVEVLKKSKMVKNNRSRRI